MKNLYSNIVCAMRKGRLFILILSGITVLLISCSTSADNTTDCESTMVGQWGLQTLEQLTRRAPVIVVGTVEDVRSEFGEYLGRDNFIYSYITIAVKTSIKGTPAGSLTVEVLGGQIGDRVMGGERSFRFTESEQVLLFLSPIDQNRYEVYGISGKLAMVRQENELYFDTSMLHKDNVSDYGYQSTTPAETIISRIINYLSLDNCS